MKFNEKIDNKTDARIYVNTGIYLFHEKIIKDCMKLNATSLEYDIIPHLIKIKKIGLYDKSINFYDFGTYERHQKILHNFNLPDWL